MVVVHSRYEVHCLLFITTFNFIPAEKAFTFMLVTCALNND